MRAPTHTGFRARGRGFPAGQPHPHDVRAGGGAGRGACPPRGSDHPRRSGGDVFRVNPKTVTRWARAGKMSAVRTLGGHRRFRTPEIRRFLEETQQLQA